MSKKAKAAAAERAKPDELTLEAVKAVRRATALFQAQIPNKAASSGHWTRPADEGGPVFPVPDGIYRVNGADWIVTFKDGVHLESARATPPAFGGPDVIEIAAE